MFYLLPPLKIHAWGGLGSQLFAISLAHDLSRRFPYRRIKVVLHTGGVTHRKPEVVDLFPNIDYSYTDDYHSSKPLESEFIEGKIRTTRNLLKIASKLLFLIETSNSDDEYDRIKFWTVSIRGHYSYRTISMEFYSQFERALRSSVKYPEFDPMSACVLHYRLGDLIILPEKSPISVNTLMRELNELVNTIHFKELVIYSDSPEVAVERFTDFVATPVSAPNVNTIEVMASSIKALYFIGTSSKISFWIAGVRASIFGLSSSLPISNKREFQNLLLGVEECVKSYPQK